ncbi:MAG: hypothetical protein PHT80_04875, partial [Lentisphaeria bacterium]|nr:hypothetical protein [Lentisphaeria bacterium]
AVAPHAQKTAPGHGRRIADLHGTLSKNAPDMAIIGIVRQLDCRAGLLSRKKSAGQLADQQPAARRSVEKGKGIFKNYFLAMTLAISTTLLE